MEDDHVFDITDRLTLLNKFLENGIEKNGSMSDGEKITLLRKEDSLSAPSPKTIKIMS